MSQTRSLNIEAANRLDLTSVRMTGLSTHDRSEASARCTLPVLAVTTFCQGYLQPMILRSAFSRLFLVLLSEVLRHGGFRMQLGFGIPGKRVRLVG